jgi:hypothetical protein
MATGVSSNYPTMKFPLASDPVNVHGDIKVLVDALNDILPPLGMTSVSSPVRNNTNFVLSAGTPVYITGNVSHSGQIKTTVERYNPSSLTHNPDAPILGLIQTGISALSDGVAVVSGVLQMNTSGIGAPGTKVYINSSGELVGGRPLTGPARYVAVVAVQGTQGLIVVQTKGNGTWGALKDGLS